jgi:hypothetical protein
MPIVSDSILHYKKLRSQLHKTLENEVIDKITILDSHSVKIPNFEKREEA